MTGASYVDYLFRALDHEGGRALLVYRGRRITRRAVRESVARDVGPLRALGLRSGDLVAALTGNRPAALVSIRIWPPAPWGAILTVLSTVELAALADAQPADMVSVLDWPGDKFIQDRRLHTGDLGHLDSEGYRYLDGRFDAESLDLDPVGS
jgi:hypothetical protein